MEKISTWLTVKEMQTKTAGYCFYLANQWKTKTTATISRLHSNHYPPVLPQVEDVSLTYRKQLDTICSIENDKNVPTSWNLLLGNNANQGKGYLKEAGITAS